MAYRKTEKVLAHAEARRNAIIAGAIDVISKHGRRDGYTIDLVAARAEVSVGTVYEYFADATEVLATAVARLLARDLEALRAAGSLEKGIRAFAKHVAANYRLMSAIGTIPAYREGIRAELSKMIKSAGVESPAILSAVVYGAVLETAGSLRPRDEDALAAALLRALGMRVKATA